jgi:hypothetical protein
MSTQLSADHGVADRIGAQLDTPLTAIADNFSTSNSPVLYTRAEHGLRFEDVTHR